MTIARAGSHGLDCLPILLVLIAALSIPGLITSGGAMSLDRQHDIMLQIHKVSTVLFLGSVAGIFIIILN